MCGLAGIWSDNILKIDDIKISLNKMSKSIKHRGPDSQGIWIDGSSGLGFAHQRLSIIDLSDAGHQPMVSNSGRYVLAFNGEIYNHMDLRYTIRKKNIGYPWRGFSDTETLLACIDLFGLQKTLSLCAGMFAFSLWDKEEKTLFLARDRFGEKPLYFGNFVNKNQSDFNGIYSSFFFASEISAIKEVLDSNLKIDTKALEGFLDFGYIPSNMSIYQGINQLPPGFLLSIKSSKNGFCPSSILKPRKWWNFAKPDQPNIYEDKK